MGSRGAITQKPGLEILRYAPQIEALWNPELRSMVRIVGSQNDLRKHQCLYPVYPCVPHVPQCIPCATVTKVYPVYPLCQVYPDVPPVLILLLKKVSYKLLLTPKARYRSRPWENILHFCPTSLMQPWVKCTYKWSGKTDRQRQLWYRGAFFLKAP